VAKDFILNRPAGDITQMIGKAKVMDLTGRYMKPRGPEWRVRDINDHNFGDWRSDWSLVRERWSHLLDAMRAGDRIRMDGRSGAFELVAHAVHDKPPIIKTEGNDDIDKIWTWARQWADDHHTSMRSGGICVPKDVFGTSAPSQHNPWKNGGSNAVDIFLGTMNAMVDMAEDAVRAAKKGRLPLGRAIIQNRIWDPTQEWHGYSGVYHYHDHLEGTPEQSGAIGSC
jgi:hypothetical protein